MKSEAEVGESEICLMQRQQCRPIVCSDDNPFFFVDVLRSEHAVLDNGAQSTSLWKYFPVSSSFPVKVAKIPQNRFTCLHALMNKCHCAE